MYRAPHPQRFFVVILYVICYKAGKNPKPIVKL